MFKLVLDKGEVILKIKEYIISDDSELSNLPLDDPFGSCAFSIASKKYFMFDGTSWDNEV